MTILKHLLIHFTAFDYVNENAQRSSLDLENGKEMSIIEQMRREGQMGLDEISRIIVDLFIAAADTVSPHSLDFSQNLTISFLRPHTLLNGLYTYWLATRMSKTNCSGKSKRLQVVKMCKKSIYNLSDMWRVSLKNHSGILKEDIDKENQKLILSLH